MATTTSKLGLRKPDGSASGDNIDVGTDINDNADKIDAAVGFFVCTSATRPTGGQRWAGRGIYETDTRRSYIWNSSLSFWMPLLVGHGDEVGPFKIGNSTDTGGEGFNFSTTTSGAHIIRSRVNNEANLRYACSADGGMAWGAGGASAQDTNLYRSAADTLKTDDSFEVAGNLTVSGTGMETAWTPAWTASAGSPAIGNGSLGGWYFRMGKNYWFTINLTAGTTTTYGTGGAYWRFGLPGGATAQRGYAGGGFYLNNLTQDYGITWKLVSGDTAFELFQSTGRITNTSPFTFGTGDVLYFSGWFRTT